MPRVYIGIPTINRPEFVIETIDSVLSQSWTDFKVTVSDNCSAEKAAMAVRRHVESIDDERIDFHAQETNVGEYGQGRYFFEQAQGFDYFVILHDDDVLEENYLETAVETLERHPELSLFMANPYVMDEDGVVSDQDTREYLEKHGRNTVAEGEADVLENYLMHGFSPISGTVIRTEALRRSGFVDSEGVGNFPFECDVFLRLGDIRARAWFTRQQLVGFRFHRSSMRNYINIYDNDRVVERTIRLFEKRQYSGRLERQRRTILCRLYRALALIRLRRGQNKDARTSIRTALGFNRKSPRTWLVAPLLFIAPGIYRSFLPELPESLVAPSFVEQSEAVQQDNQWADRNGERTRNHV